MCDNIFASRAPYRLGTLMIRIYPGDFLGIEYKGRYYNAIFINKRVYFGGNWVYVFHFSSSKLRSACNIIRQMSWNRLFFIAVEAWLGRWPRKFRRSLPCDPNRRPGLRCVCCNPLAGSPVLCASRKSPSNTYVAHASWNS